MKRRWILFPIIAIIGGCASFIIRLLQNRTGFEPSTGLPIPGNTAANALIILLLILSIALFALVFLLPKNAHCTLPFPIHNRVSLTLSVLGTFLLGLSGCIDILEGFSGSNIVLQMSNSARYMTSAENVLGFSSGMQSFLGLLSLLSAVGLFMYIIACSRQNHYFASEVLLIPPVSFVIRLIATYRVDSVNPVLESYGSQLLALTFLALGFYYLVSLAFKTENIRRFAFCASLGIIFSCCSIADSVNSPVSLCFYLGNALALLGFLLLGLQALISNAAFKVSV